MRNETCAGAVAGPGRSAGSGFILALAMGLGAGGAAAQVPATEPPAELVAAARAEGKLMLYASVSEPQIEALLGGFERAYGIRGEYLRLVSTPLIQRFVTAADAGAHEADVFFDSSPTAFDQHPQLFAGLDGLPLPSLAVWPKEWLGTNQGIIQTSLIVVQYNSDLVPAAEVPADWTDILDPKWRGKISLTDPRASNTYLGWLDAMERAHGPDFVRRLGQQDLTLVQSGAAGAQMVAAGSQVLNFPGYASFAVPLIEAGAPIAWAKMSNPQSVNQGSMAVVKDAPNPNAARLFVNWIFSPDGLRTMCGAFPLSSPGDPTGAYGCIPVENPELVNYAVPPERRQELLTLLGLGEK